MEKLTNNDITTSDFASLVRLLLEQQRGIRELVEDITKDVEVLKHQVENVLVIKTKIDVIDKEFDNEKRIRSDCQRNVDSRLTDIINKRENINLRINEIERTINSLALIQSKESSMNLEKLRTELESKIESKTKSISDSVKDIQLDIKGLSKSVAFDSGKYGGIVGLVITIIMFLAKTLWDHLIKK